ncbi:LPD7 domain-containing protein [Paraburkholderia phenoliruptrix]|uniref:LPD7 domain-containing protein n=1 Tax=Paraburkholderia phenoliruptrix TaxID=252970 RepID=UPI001C6EA770|nr:LPD7 domain-containing protein [Paraburkholderia phenoliruptrix]MBW9105103.1 DNA primase [Paraburkholderia phenoliruptrix]MBW9129749.1 DNA primase [Paraburkholderia ginsengiterrae]
MTEISSFADPVINVIEQDIFGRPSAEAQSSADGRNQRLDEAAMGAVAARRRREFDAALARLRDQATRDEGLRLDPDSRAVVSEPAEFSGKARVPLEQAPERVRKRYLRAGNQYFLKDAPYQLAFEDLGPYLATEHNRPDVVESMVDMAAAKSWRRIRVSGHEAFRSEVWLQATVLGIEVSGYEPKPADLARLADARQTWLNNRIEADASVGTTGAPPKSNESIPPASVSTSRDGAQSMTVGASSALRSAAPSQYPVPEHLESRLPATSDEPEAPRRYAGELREHGHAPYQNNPARSDSYYVVFRDAAGVDQVVWGVDLERAVQESRAAPGDRVVLENQGRRLVTVKAPIFDSQGVMVGEDEKDVHRNTWQVEVVDRHQSVSESRFERAPDGTMVPTEGARKDSRERPRSTVSDEDKVLHLAVLTGAMREQGFSARSISRVRQRAEAMLDAFARDGTSVPRPRVFDLQAPSERERRARAAPERARTRELELTPAEQSLPAR